MIALDRARRFGATGGYAALEFLTARMDVKLILVRNLLLIAVLSTVVPAKLFGAGSSNADIPHRDLWPDAVSSAAEFDRASRAEILAFAHELAASDAFSQAALKERLGVDSVDMPAVERLRDRLWRILSKNYAIAAAGCAARQAFCPVDPASTSFRHEAETFSDAWIAPRYAPWLTDAVRFHRTYLDGLLRLAAEFPQRNSEVETFNDNEMTGWQLNDRQFLLSFDDGPTGGPAGPQANADDTDRTLDMLRRNHLNAVFFAIGQSFQTRLRDSSIEAMKTLYSGMCVGSHGWVHTSHAILPQWQASIASSSQLIHDTLADSYVPAFRPPYGQRPPDSGPYLRRRGLKLILWNIDSLDWNDSLSADDVEQRVMSLMLLWRRGIILFHDLHPRARMVVPRLVSWLARDDIAWVDCHQVNW